MASSSLRYESNRLKTFDPSWPLPFLSPRDLAKVGFYFIGPHDKVQCIFCNVQLHKWKKGDNVALEHYYWSPRCRFLKCHDITPNIWMDESPDELLKVLPESESYDEVDVYYDTEGCDECGSHIINRQTKMNHEEDRLKTFQSKWPLSFIDSKILAKTGFFYVGPNDDVICNFCGIHILCWEDGDDVVREHYRLSPHCTFLRYHENTKNVPIGPAEELEVLFAPIIYAVTSYPSISDSKFMNYTRLEKGYYTVSKMKLIDRGSVTHVRVDLQNDKFIIIRLQHTESLIIERNLKKLAKSSNMKIMKVLTDTKDRVVFYFYESENFPLYYQESELLENWDKVHVPLNVLLLSVVKINNEERIKVNVFPRSYFILPKEHTQVTVDNIEHFNKKRLMVNVEVHYKYMYTVIQMERYYDFYFYGEECKKKYIKVYTQDVIESKE